LHVFIRDEDFRRCVLFYELYRPERLALIPPPFVSRVLLLQPSSTARALTSADTGSAPSTGTSAQDRHAGSSHKEKPAVPLPASAPVVRKRPLPPKVTPSAALPLPQTTLTVAAAAPPLSGPTYHTAEATAVQPPADPVPPEPPPLLVGLNKYFPSPLRGAGRSAPAPTHAQVFALPKAALANHASPRPPTNRKPSNGSIPRPPPPAHPAHAPPPISTGLGGPGTTLAAASHNSQPPSAAVGSTAPEPVISHGGLASS
jgi:hypothetical protein